jgi:hypothetical protein
MSRSGSVTMLRQRHKWCYGNLTVTAVICSSGNGKAALSPCPWACNGGEWCRYSPCPSTITMHWPLEQTQSTIATSQFQVEFHLVMKQFEVKLHLTQYFILPLYSCSTLCHRSQYFEVHWPRAFYFIPPTWTDNLWLVRSSCFLWHTGVPNLSGSIDQAPFSKCGGTNCPKQHKCHSQSIPLWDTR